MANHQATIRNIISELRHNGWEVRDGKHWVVYPPQCREIIVIAKTPSHDRVVKRVLLLLIKRAQHF
jgi:hypothetical protein